MDFSNRYHSTLGPYPLFFTTRDLGFPGAPNTGQRRPKNARIKTRGLKMASAGSLRASTTILAALNAKPLSQRFLGRFLVLGTADLGFLGTPNTGQRTPDNARFKSPCPKMALARSLRDPPKALCAFNALPVSLRFRKSDKTQTRA